MSQRIVITIDIPDGVGLEVGPSSPASGPAAAFANAAPPPAIPAGNCPVHNIPWRTTKADGSPAKRAYCSEKQDNGDFCDQRGPWLQSR